MNMIESKLERKTWSDADTSLLKETESVMYYDFPEFLLVRVKFAYAHFFNALLAQTLLNDSFHLFLPCIFTPHFHFSITIPPNTDFSP